MSAFLEAARAPGFVFSVTIRAARGKRAINERILSTPWFQALQVRLGKNYANDYDRPERVSLARVLRGTSDPSTILDELCHVAAAVDGKILARRGTKGRSPRAKESKPQRDDVWKIIDALGPTGWRASSMHKPTNLR